MNLMHLFDVFVIVEVVQTQNEGTKKRKIADNCESCLEVPPRLSPQFTLGVGAELPESDKPLVPASMSGTLQVCVRSRIFREPWLLSGSAFGL